MPRRLYLVETIHGGITENNTISQMSLFSIIFNKSGRDRRARGQCRLGKTHNKSCVYDAG